MSQGGQGSLCCQACQLAFADFELQRAHYKTEFHRFNLRRKVAGLPHISQPLFDEKVAQIESEQQKKTAEPVRQYCKACRKRFTNVSTYDTHLSSKKHLTMEKQLATADAAAPEISSHDGDDVVVVDDDDATTSHDGGASAAGAADASPASSSAPAQVAVRRQFHARLPEPPKPVDEMTDEELIQWRFANAIKLNPEEDCLFCSIKSQGLEANLKHMSRYHRFYIPYIEYLTDPRAFMGYLGQKVSVGHLCLYCNEKGKSFHSLGSVRDHMRSLNHCKIQYDECEDEYSRFYDFSASYAAYLPPLSDDPHAAASSDAPAERRPKAPRAVGDDDASSDDDTPDPVFEEIIRRAKRNVQLSDCGTELVLVSAGQVIGHRAFQVYHRQKYSAGDSREAVLIGKMMDHYRKHGYVARHQDVYATKEYRKIQQVKNKAMMKLGCQANWLQHTYREQNPK